jgi:ribonucleoside-diphosphate reductase beta chain
MSITEPRLAYKVNGEFEFPEYFNRYQKAIASIWRVQEVSFDPDVRDWQQATDTEREIIGGILRGFTTLEQIIGDYWCDEVCRMFPKPEIVSMARAYSTFESVHAEAYTHLSDTLGLDEFEAFLGDPIAQKKIEEFSKYNGKVALGIFSGAGEGVSLFSSFAVLLSFNRTGRFKGLAQVISWSALDEQQHSDGACSLFRQLVREQGLTDEERLLIKSGFDAVLENERAFLANIFRGREVNGLTAEALDAYMLQRANNRLRELGIYNGSDCHYDYDAILANSVKEWFDVMVMGQKSTDFFAASKSGDNYVAKPIQNFSSVDLSSIDLVLR